MFIAGSLSYPKKYTFFLPVKLEIADDVSMFAWFIITSFEFTDRLNVLDTSNIHFAIFVGFDMLRYLCFY